MGRTDEEFAVVAEGLNRVEADMAKNVLEEAGIPSMIHQPDFDFVEIGRAAHDMVRGTKVLVPHAAVEKARKVLDAVWGQAEDLE